MRLIARDVRTWSGWFRELRRPRSLIIRAMVGAPSTLVCAATAILVALCGRSSAGEPVRPSPTTLLEAYQKAMGVAERIAFKSETITAVDGALTPSASAPWLHKHEYRRDGDRFDVYEEKTRMTDDGRPDPGTNTRTRSILDGDQWYHFVRREDDGSSQLLVSAQTQVWGSWTRRMLSAASAADGYLPGDGDAALWQVMGEASSLRLRPGMELVDGRETYVLEARGRYGEHVLWLDPEAGFNARRISVRKTGADLLGDKPVNTPPPRLPARSIPQYPQVPVEEYTFVLDGVQIEKSGDVFLPVKASLTTTYKHTDGSVVVFRRAHERSEIQIDPDFEAMGAFVLDSVPDRTPASNMDVAGAGVEFQWLDGQIRPRFDASALSRLDGLVDQELMGAAPNDVDANEPGSDESATSPAPTDKTPISGDSSADVANASARQGTSRLLLIILMGLGALILAAVVWFRLLRRSSRTSS